MIHSFAGHTFTEQYMTAAAEYKSAGNLSLNSSHGLSIRLELEIGDLGILVCSDAFFNNSIAHDPKAPV